MTDVLDAGLLAMEPDLPPQANALRNEKTSAVLDRANGGDIWNAFEIARRFEHGDRVALNAVCAYFWYETAGALFYPVGAAAYPTMRTMHPSAQKGMARLSDDLDVAAARTAGRGRDQSCRAAPVAGDQ